MRLRTLALGALALLALAYAGLWTLDRVMPRLARPKGTLAAAAMEPTTADLNRELARHPRLEASDGRGREAIIWAARAGRPHSISLLAEAGAPASFQDQGPNGWQPLHHAVHKNQLASVRALLAAGAEVDGTNPDGLTPLMLAASQGEGEIVEALLAAGADPRRRGPHGDNALTYAVFGGDARTVRALRARAPELSPGHGFQVRLGRFALFLRGRGEVLRLLDERLIAAGGSPR